MARRVHVNRQLYGPLKLQLSRQQTGVQIKKNAHVTAATLPRRPATPATHINYWPTALT